MGRKAFFQRHSFDFPINNCWFCQGKPEGILTFIKSGEEIKTCMNCAVKEGKIRRFNEIRHNTITLSKETKFNPILRIKNNSNEVLKDIPRIKTALEIEQEAIQ